MRHSRVCDHGKLACLTRLFQYAITTLSSAFLDHRWYAHSHTSRRYRSQHHSIGPDTTIITNVDLSEELSAGANEDVMPNAWSPTPPSQVAQGYPMIEGTAFSYDSFGMHDDTTEVMDAQAWSYRGLSWNGNPGRDINKT